MKKITGWIFVVTAAIALLISSPSSRAEELKLWNDAFQADGLPLHGETTTLLGSHSPDVIQLISAAQPKSIWYGWATVNLPVGRTISKTIFYHGGSSAGKMTSCMLVRVKMGKEPLVIASGYTNGVNACKVTLTVPDSTKLAIEPGYRYFARVFLSDGTSFRGVKILY